MENAGHSPSFLYFSGNTSAMRKQYARFLQQTLFETLVIWVHSQGSSGWATDSKPEAPTSNGAQTFAGLESYWLMLMGTSQQAIWQMVHWPPWFTFDRQTRLYFELTWLFSSEVVVKDYSKLELESVDEIRVSSWTDFLVLQRNLFSLHIVMTYKKTVFPKGMYIFNLKCTGTKSQWTNVW